MATIAAPTAEQPSALAIVVDVSPSAWVARPRDELAALLDDLLVFANAFHLLSASNQLMVLCVNPSETRFAWPPSDSRAADAACSVEPRALRIALDTVVQQLLAAPPPDTTPAGSPLAAALGLALCRLQRVRRAQPKVQPRILVVHASADLPAHHLACMNCVFAAQKQTVLIDAVALAPHDSLLLQQAAELTGGSYVRPDGPTRAGLSQYLLTCCLPDQYARGFLSAPARGKLEARATCHVSKRPVEVGWACSVCLTVFADEKRSELRECPVCGTRFPLAAARPPPKKKKAKAAASAVAAPPAPASTPTQRITLPPPPAASESTVADWQRSGRG